VAGAEHGHQLDRALTAEVAAMCVITRALFPGQGYDLILARTFRDARRPGEARHRDPVRNATGFPGLGLDGWFSFR
jgi:hypothetical protein